MKKYSISISDTDICLVNSLSLRVDMIIEVINLFRFIIAFVILIFIPANSYAVLTQPDGAQIPSNTNCNSGQPYGLAAVFACICTESGICNIGDACSSENNCPDGVNGTCETTLWHSFNDNSCIPSNISGLNPWNDAALTPETITPGSKVKFTLVFRGSSQFKNIFGWYNVTGSAPGTDDLNVILDSTSSAGNTVELDIRNDSNWKGGDIGFFIITPESHSSSGACSDNNCYATLDRYKTGAGYAYFSEKKYSDGYAGASSCIHLLIYKSRVTDGKYYFAWDDTYSVPDNNFIDIVASVENINSTTAGKSKNGQGCGCGSGNENDASSAFFFGYMVIRGFLRKKSKGDNNL